MVKFIKRIAKDQVKERLFKGKVVIIYGARQVGKTTLVKQILEDFGDQGRYLNCELPSVQNALSSFEPAILRSYLGSFKLVVLDEAQSIPDIGKKLKIVIDTFPEMQIIATGSSSFDLSSKVSEPLTGRSFVISLHPLSAEEIIKDTDLFSFDENLERMLRFGLYPEVYTLSENDAIERLNEITADYLYKDILRIEGIKKSSVIQKLLQLLALQIAHEVNYQELAVSLGINRLTVQKYLDILEQNFIIFQLRALSRNPRKEISKSVKIFFTDIGIRNSIIQNYNPIHVRNDIGSMWENFCVIERLKRNTYAHTHANAYFWRNYEKREVDYVEESKGSIRGYEFKWNGTKKYVPPKNFTAQYGSDIRLINKNNFRELLLP
jgi:hypothetical protein